ncbi:MAG TPA: right-handed parallel beta-helix repeat-containing protein [Pyrinomonadaceae bacterium]|nr:right-handed parallel beta-helix repeat-containing protein [Pyrinomonadaceae bacterium]
MNSKTPIAFMSYVHLDDKYKQLTTFRERLGDEIQVQTGNEFHIFQDRRDIQWGQNWRQRIENSLDETTFLIPIITPSFFNSEPCRDELARFVEREKTLGRNDLILPVYFVDTPLLNEAELRAADELAEVIASRQYADWRELRFEPFTNPQVGKMLEQLALQVRNALPRVENVKKVPIKTRGTPDAQAAGVTKGETEGQSTKSPQTKKDSPTRIVDPMYWGDFVTITEAIKNSGPGTRIIVRPGLYQEGLIIDKPLEIIGDGEPGEVVVQAIGMDVILFQTTMGRVVNLVLRQMGGEKWYGVDITQGRLELEDCDITSESLACVGIHGGASPRLRRNRIHDSKNGNGVLVYQNAQGTLEDNDIFRNAFSDVEIKSGSNPTLRRNRIHDSKPSGGVLVHEGGQGIFEDNDIFGSELAGVEIKNTGNPTLRRNRIYESKTSGILVFDGGLGILEDNEIFGNANSGVQIKTAGNPTLRRNRIRNNKQSGVYVYESGLGMLEDNEIVGNRYSGILSTEGGNPIVKKNRVYENDYYGVAVNNNGGGTFEDNDLTKNVKGAWFISADSDANVKRFNNKE